MESKNNNLGKFDKKAIYLNHGKYGYFLTHNKINYKIPEWVPHEKIDLELASNYIDYKIKWNEKLKSENEGPKEDPLDKESD
jgi:topoisomerase IA-like protein